MDLLGPINVTSAKLPSKWWFRGEPAPNVVSEPLKMRPLFFFSSGPKQSIPSGQLTASRCLKGWAKRLQRLQINMEPEKRASPKRTFLPLHLLESPEQNKTASSRNSLPLKSTETKKEEKKTYSYPNGSLRAIPRSLEETSTTMAQQGHSFLTMHGSKGVDASKKWWTGCYPSLPRRYSDSAALRWLYTSSACVHQGKLLGINKLNAPKESEHPQSFQLD